MAYTVWLVCEALAVAPSGSTLDLPSWAGLTLAAFSLLSTAVGAGGFDSSGSGSAAASSATSAPSGQAVEARSPLAAAESGEAGCRTAPQTSSSEEAAAVTGKEAFLFALHCALQASASLYVTASLAPKAGSTTYGFRVAAIFTSLALYGWSLIAPKVLTGRSFS
eukprot:TRINITY_DN66075_c0_g1_i1.p1 TRINITY_DN66075_c0_g1~~TRINITY_DN66075_c0_g1_i1.p1  ORF type:complete len:193 (+),score=42.54 TRINITY_DN66075_c0_g1_i1:86-580(+)